MENKDEMRKGPWTEQEDVQLNLYVKLFGDRRWDFIAKVSGLKRTGKSCRLRWVNYLHPGLKRGKMTPTEECLIVQLHSKFGNRWSKIAEKIPGRTDNEIKNYWRTYMRKEAQKRKKATVMSRSSSSSHSSSSTCNSSPRVDFNQVIELNDQCFYNSGGLEMIAQRKTGLEIEESTKVYSLDEIWNEIETSEQNYDLTCNSINSPMFDCFQSDSLWSLDEEQSKILMYPTIGDNIHSFLF